MSEENKRLVPEGARYPAHVPLFHFSQRSNPAHIQQEVAGVPHRK